MKTKILIALLAILISINIYLLLKPKTYNKSLKTSFYDLDESCYDYIIGKNKIIRKYIFNNSEILNIEKEDLEKKDYKVTVNDLEITATKSGNLKCKK